MKKQLYRAAAATVLGLSLTTGVVAADGMPSYSHYGNNKGHGYQMPKKGPVTRTTSTNNSNVGITNTTNQQAYTGNATASGGKSYQKNWYGYGKKSNYKPSTAGTATTGPATNKNSTDATVKVKQMPAVPAAPVSYNSSSKHSGPSSPTTVTTSVNNSTVAINNQTNQYAATGDATVSGNGNGGNATTGAATNHNSSSFTVNVTQGN